jgi:hypothetical protein
MGGFLVCFLSFLLSLWGGGLFRFLWECADAMRTEVKVLKSRVRDVIDPHRDLGHTDRALRQGQSQRLEKEADKCEDCQT